MSLGLPNFNFIFQSKGVSAIERSARGIVAVILKDDTEGEEQNVYNKVDDVDFTQWTEDNYNYLKLIYEGAPSKVIAMRVATNVESYNAVLKKLKDLKWNYLCIPGIKAADTTMIGAWIKQYRNDEKKTFKVVLPHYAGDHEGIINFTTENITSSVTGKKHTAAEYCARIAGILAGLSLSRSSTLTEEELAGKEISEIGLYDANGDIVNIKRFSAKGKDADLAMTFWIKDTF